MNRALRCFFHAPVHLYRWHFGWILGHRLLMLIHTGRRTGKRRETVLEVMQFRPNGPEVVVMSGFGRGAGWLRNIEANPEAVEIIVGVHRFVAVHRLLDTAEAIRVIADYERRNRLITSVVRAGFGALLGWRYKGSAEDRRRLAAQLPLIEFRPAATQAR